MTERNRFLGEASSGKEGSFVGFKSHPPRHLRDADFAQFSLVLSVEQQKIDFKLGAAFDFTLAFKTVAST